MHDSVLQLADLDLEDAATVHETLDLLLFLAEQLAGLLVAVGVYLSELCVLSPKTGQLVLVLLLLGLGKERVLEGCRLVVFVYGHFFPVHLHLDLSPFCLILTAVHITFFLFELALESSVGC